MFEAAPWHGGASFELVRVEEHGTASTGHPARSRRTHPCRAAIAAEVDPATSRRMTGWCTFEAAPWHGGARFKRVFVKQLRHVVPVCVILRAVAGSTPAGQPLQRRWILRLRAGWQADALSRPRRGTAVPGSSGCASNSTARGPCVCHPARSRRIHPRRAAVAAKVDPATSRRMTARCAGWRRDVQEDGLTRRRTAWRAGWRL